MTTLTLTKEYDEYDYDLIELRKKKPVSRKPALNSSHFVSYGFYVRYGTDDSYVVRFIESIGSPIWGGVVRRSHTEHMESMIASMLIPDETQELIRASHIQDKPMNAFVSQIPESIQQRILAFQRPANINTEGASAISRDDTNTAIVFLAEAKRRIPNMKMPFSVSPSVRGGIAIHWMNNRYELYVRVTAKKPDSIYYQWEDPSGKSFEGYAPKETLIEKLSAMYA